MDIRQYFAAIDHEVLEDQLRRVLKDRRLFDVISRIIRGGRVPEPYQAYFPGDDLFSPHERPKGLPIGNLTSQLWANTYLSGFDHWVKQRLGVKAYLRFVDDFLLLHDDREVLIDWRNKIREKLRELRLLAHPRKCIVRPTTEGIPFLGYVVWPNRIRVRGETVRRFRRRLRRRARKRMGPNRRSSLEAWMGHVQLAGSWRELKVKRRKPAAS